LIALAFASYYIYRKQDTGLHGAVIKQFAAIINKKDSPVVVIHADGFETISLGLRLRDDAKVLCSPVSDQPPSWLTGSYFSVRIGRRLASEAHCRYVNRDTDSSLNQ
jgi:hypothetical protein